MYTSAPYALNIDFNKLPPQTQTHTRVTIPSAKTVKIGKLSGKISKQKHKQKQERCCLLPTKHCQKTIIGKSLIPYNVTIRAVTTRWAGPPQSWKVGGSPLLAGNSIENSEFKRTLEFHGFPTGPGPPLWLPSPPLENPWRRHW